MSNDYSLPAILAYLLILIGLIGAVVPVLPGPLLIWLGALVWAWADGFTRVGWPTVIFLLVLAIASWASDYALNMAMSRRAGASWKSIAGAIVGGILGGLFLTGLIPIPIVGTMAGAAIGAMLGAFFVEYLNTRDVRAAWRALKAYLGSMVVSSLLEIAIAVFMVVFFAWQAFF